MRIFGKERGGGVASENRGARNPQDANNGETSSIIKQLKEKGFPPVFQIPDNLNEQDSNMVIELWVNHPKVIG